MQKAVIYFYSDFGNAGPYVGQVESVICSNLSLPFIRLLDDAPVFNPKASAYLLNALYQNLPVRKGALLAVVDPGVGSDRKVISFTHDEMLFIAPDNGLFSVLIKQLSVQQVVQHEQPVNLSSNSFHGRDWFAPLLVDLMQDKSVPMSFLQSSQLIGYDWPAQLNEIIYIDHYGNLITGLKAADCDKQLVILWDDIAIRYADAFSAVADGELMWYGNSMGLVEIARNGARADNLTDAAIGRKIELVQS